MSNDTGTNDLLETRPIWKIADEIKVKWKKVNYAAAPYLEAMEQLGTIENLQTLSITNSPIDNESLKHLSNLQQLVSLRLQGTKVTGEGMATLKEKLKNLRSMSPAAIPKKPAK